MSTTAASINFQIDQLCINTIRTLSMDAVQQAKSGHPGTPDGARAAGLHHLESRHALRSAGSDLAQSRPVRALERPRLDAALVRAAPHPNAGRQRRVRDAGPPLGDARRHPPLSPARQQSARPSGVPLGLGRRNHHRPARSGRRDQRRHGHRAEVARRPLQPARLHDLRLQHLRRLRRWLPDGRRRRRKRRRSPATWASTTSAGSTTTTTSPSKATRRITFTEDVATRFLGYGWNVLRVGRCQRYRSHRARSRAFSGRRKAGPP